MSKIKMSDEDLVKYVIDARRRAKFFRDAYQEDVDSCIEQYNCKHPEEWKKKEKWQTKVFIPLAYKNVEVGASMLGKMLFSQKDFFEITGFNPDENDLRESLTSFTVHVLQKGNFYNIAMLALKEACITSTSFLKTIDVSKGNDFTLNFIPRTFHDILIDPSVSTYWINARFVIDEYERDVSDILGNPIYDYGKKYFNDIKDFAMTTKSFSDETRKALESVQEGGADVTYKPHYILEFHGRVKDPETQEDSEMIITVCDEKWIIRRDEVDSEEDRAYDVIRVNPIPKQFYGSGMIHKDIDIQKLANGVINLWMDNWKLSAMKMIAVDPAGDVKWDTVKFEPAAIWQVAKGAINPIEVGVAVDGMTALGILDQLSQETTGLTKTAQGMSTPGTDETLGEVEIKLARSDQRFINVAKFIEAEFLGRFIKKIVNYIIENCPQSYVDKIMGFKEVKRKLPIPMVGEFIQQAQNFVNRVFRVRRLDLDYIRRTYGKKGKEVALDFRPIGISRFSTKAEEQARYKELLQAVLSNETLGMMFDIRKLVKRSLQAIGFDNIDDLLKSDEDIEAMLEQLQGGQSQGSAGRVPGMENIPQAPQEQNILSGGV